MHEMDPRYAWAAALAGLACLIIEPVVVQGLWALVIAPLTHWARINWAQAFGLLCLASMFRYEPKNYASPKAEYEAARWTLIHAVIMLPAVWAAMWWVDR